MGGEVTYRAGDRYSITQGRFHWSYVPNDELTATLVRTTNHEDRRPQVLGSLAVKRTEYEYCRDQVAKVNFVRLVEAVIERMK